MRNRLQALNMLDRALAATDDATLELLLAGLDEAAHEALASVVALPSAEGHYLSVAGLRAAAERGRMNGGL
jgi:hypothetical protein